MNLQVSHRPDGLSTDSEIGKKDLSHLVNRELKAADTWLESSPNANLGEHSRVNVCVVVLFTANATQIWRILERLTPR